MLLLLPTGTEKAKEEREQTVACLLMVKLMAAQTCTQAPAKPHVAENL